MVLQNNSNTLWFWRTITDQQQLISKSTDELEIIIKDCIEQAITKMAVTSPDTFKESFTRIEKQRLLQLMLAWLTLESQRAAFKVVDTERELNININGVEAKLYIDRVDELENGHQLLIDYKTGLVSPSDWFGERPNDPQLPLYSIASGEKLSAVLFAQLRTGELKFNGVVEESELIPNLPPNRKGVLREATEQWPEVLTEWNTILKSLADDFVQSKIAVDPKDGISTCRKLYCELSALCRINELIDSNSDSENIIDNDMAEE
jgi:ATP-dependent helicase/DNAse subunit B